MLIQILPYILYVTFAHIFLIKCFAKASYFYCCTYVCILLYFSPFQWKQILLIHGICNDSLSFDILLRLISIKFHVFSANNCEFANKMKIHIFCYGNTFWICDLYTFSHCDLRIKSESLWEFSVNNHVYLIPNGKMILFQL